MARRKYDPLPQFEESDSDVDIFNAKSKKEGTKSNLITRVNSKCTCNVKICAAFLAILVVIAIIVATYTYNRKSLQQTILIETGYLTGFNEIVTIGKRKQMIHRFSGIPFAEPPIRDRRWSPPVPKKKWSGTVEANKQGIRCMQEILMNDKFAKVPSEDCLYLHVLTPSLNPAENLDVLVWFHGGYSMNTYSDMPGYTPDPEFIASMHVVSVAINFRLNAFGYLTLSQLWKTNVSYGNYGLMDQILGLKWIQQNIRQFGGNPDSVTVVGQSSGGTSIYALIASPLADGLFHKAIPMSGSSNFPKTYVESANDNVVFLNNTDCSRESVEAIQKCLYQLSAYKVLAAMPLNIYPFWAMSDLQDFPVFGHLDGALFVVEPVYLPFAPKDVYKLQKKTRISILLGHTAQEPGINGNEKFANQTKLEVTLGERLKPFNVSISDVMKAYQNFSKKSTVASSASQRLYETIVTDVRTSCPTNVLWKQFQRNPQLSQTYRYVVKYRPKNPIYVNNMYFHNAFHSLDAMSLFGMKMFTAGGSYNITPEDKKFIKTIRKIVKNFMANGKVKGATTNDTIIFDESGGLKTQPGDYQVEQCKIWNQNVFKPYAWIN